MKKEVTYLSYDLWCLARRERGGEEKGRNMSWRWLGSAWGSRSVSSSNLFCPNSLWREPELADL